MKKLEMFFDYNCPYCLKGHEQLVDFLKSNPVQEIIWHPCEISVFKNEQGKPTDISIQGMFFAVDNNVDLLRYHEKVYNLIFKDKVNTKDINTFTSALDGLLDTDALRKALESGKYVKNVNDANRFAFEETGVHVVPTFRADGGFLQDRQEFFKMGPSDTGYGGTK